MMLNLGQVLVGLLVAAIISFSAYKLNALKKSGAWAAFALGTIVFGLGGFSWAVVLMVFFASSSGLSFLFKKRKSIFEEKFAKGSKRDARQVLANGGLAGLAVISHVFFPGSIIPWAAFAAVFAAANADTWATELGVLNKKYPRLIHTGQVVPPGTSGGVSLFGLIAAVSGSMIIALAALICWPLTGLASEGKFLAAVFVFIAGIFGSLIDSLIGATIQGIFWCPGCQKETEKHPLHGCGMATELIRGKKWITNDWVNLLCTGSAILLVIFMLVAFL